MIKNSEGIFRLRTISPSRLFAYYNLAFWQRATDGSIILMHHRLPTSTPNKSRCNHPIANETEDIFLIHNGIMNNGLKELKQSHTFETREGKAFTDSEIIVHLLEELLDQTGSMETAIKELPKKLTGSYAIGIVHKGEHRIYLLKNYMPIVISQDKEGNTFFSSTLSDVANFTKIKEMNTDEIGYIDNTGYHCLKEGYSMQSYYYNWKKGGKDDSRDETKWLNENTKWGSIDDAQSNLSRAFDYYPYGFGMW